ncbi:hypothetical protein BDQ17DRAFT_1372819 [Cyathus striatus]|nr:hypothetical protein BDQ17DRAFT_1372819 [Cyathus striatus]
MPISHRALSNLKSRTTLLNALFCRVSSSPPTSFPRTRILTFAADLQLQPQSRALHTTTAPISIRSLFYRARYRTNGARRSIWKGVAIAILSLYSIHTAIDTIAWVVASECQSNTTEIVWDLQQHLLLMPIDRMITGEELQERISMILRTFIRVDNEIKRVEQLNWIKNAIWKDIYPKLAFFYYNTTFYPDGHPSHSLITKFEQDFRMHPKRWQKIVDSKMTINQYATVKPNFNEMIASAPEDAAKFILYRQFEDLYYLIKEDAQAGYSSMFTMMRLTHCGVKLAEMLFDIAVTIDAGDGDSGVHDGEARF